MRDPSQVGFKDILDHVLVERVCRGFRQHPSLDILGLGGHTEEELCPVLFLHVLKVWNEFHSFIESNGQDPCRIPVKGPDIADLLEFMDPFQAPYNVIG